MNDRVVKEKRGWSLSTLTLIGLGLGIAVGLLIGEYAAVLKPIGDVWVQLLQMTILPYIVVSLIGAIGRMTYREAALIAGKAGLVMLMIWGIVILVVWLLSLSFPKTVAASFFSTSLLETPERVDFIDLYIPANPFNSLANSVVPAVVLFSLAVAAALIGVDEKGRILDMVDVMTKALTRVAMAFVKLTPIGVFAIGASAVGTMAIEDFGRLQVYFGAFIAGSVLLTFWFLPAMILVTTPVRYRKLFRTSRDTLVTAFSTGNLFICLPLIVENCEKLLGGGESDETGTPVEALVPLGFNFPHAGKIMALLFVPFAAWFAGIDLTPTDQAVLVFPGLFTVFASTHVAIPFLLDSVRVPVDMYQLFLATGLINVRFAAMAAAMSLLTFALVASAVVERGYRMNWRRVGGTAVLSVVITLLVVVGLRAVFGTLVSDAYNKDQVIAGMQILEDPVSSIVRTAPLPPEDRADVTLPVLQQVRERGRLRVGYGPDRLPWSYFNTAGELVGFDIEMAHLLAQDLGVTLEFVPLDVRRLDEQLDRAEFDIAMSGIGISAYRLERARFVPYVDLTLGLIVADEKRNELDTIEKVAAQPDLRIGLAGDDYFRDQVAALFPLAEVELLDTQDEFVDGSTSFDLMVSSAEGGSAWTLLHPEYSVIVPEDWPLRLPAGYGVAADQEAFARFLEGWVGLKRGSGELQRVYDHWVLGKDAEPQRPRWSVIRNVLGWVE